MYSIVTIVYNTVFIYLKPTKRVELKCSLSQEGKHVMCWMYYLTQCGKSLHNVYKHQIITLNTLNVLQFNLSIISQ